MSDVKSTGVQSRARLEVRIDLSYGQKRQPRERVEVLRRRVLAALGAT